MSQDQPATLLAALIAHDQLTLADAAQKIESASRTTGVVSVTSRHVGRLARGERAAARPNPALARALQEAFGRPVGELLAPFDAAALSTTPAREGAARTLTTEVVTMAADRARRFAKLETASSDVVEMLRADVRDLTQTYPNRPLHELLGHLGSGQEQVFDLLERPQRPTQTRDLYFLAGVLSGMLAKASHDLADPHAAQVQARTAWMCAEQADHHGLRAWIAGLQSLVAYWAKRPHDSIRYAQRGARFAETANSTAGVWLPANEARAWAALGNTSAAHEAIGRASAAWSRVQADDLDELGGIATFSRPRQLYYAGDALAWLPGVSDAALGYSEEAVGAYEDTLSPDFAFSDAAGSHCDLAISRLHSRNIEGADVAMTSVLALPPEQRINGIVHSVQRVHTALNSLTNDPAAADLQERIEAYMRTPLASLPR